MAKRHWLRNLLFPQTDKDEKEARTAEKKIRIAEMKARGDAEGLIEMLKSRDYTVTSDIVQALTELGDTAVDSLVRFADDENQALRCSVVGLLAKSRETQAIDALCRMLNDESLYVQTVAERALVETPDARAVASLIQAAEAEKASVRVQVVLRFVLTRTAEDVPTEVLRQAAQLNDSYVLIYAQVDSSCTFTAYNAVPEERDFTQIKQIARQELIRRGLEA